MNEVIRVEAKNIQEFISRCNEILKAYGFYIRTNCSRQMHQFNSMKKRQRIKDTIRELLKDDKDYYFSIKELASLCNVCKPTVKKYAKEILTELQQEFKDIDVNKKIKISKINMQ